jgi:hypothetical protein
MFFRISAAAELGRPALSGDGLRQLRRPRFVASVHGDSRNTQAPLAKIDIRSKTSSLSVTDVVFYLQRVARLGLEQHLKIRAGTDAPL